MNTLTRVFVCCICFCDPTAQFLRGKDRIHCSCGTVCTTHSMQLFVRQLWTIRPRVTASESAFSCRSFCSFGWSSCLLVRSGFQPVTFTSFALVTFAQNRLYCCYFCFQRWSSGAKRRNVRTSRFEGNLELLTRNWLIRFESDW